MSDDLPSAPDLSAPVPHRRRVRYGGKNPRRFADKYKEHQPGQFPETQAKVLASGKTPAGTHRPIMVEEILSVLQPRAGDVVADCTLGYGGHAEEILRRLQPGGRLLGLDVDPLELPKTEMRLRGLGFALEVFSTHLSNYAGLAKILAAEGLAGAHLILADLGVSSMQIDNPARGFSVKLEGPLDMRMNPQRGRPASEFLQRIEPAELMPLLQENADEPHAERLANVLAGRFYASTGALRAAILNQLQARPAEERELSVRRVFQALRIAVNDEFAALETFLRLLPSCLAPGGRVAILTFHSGEDRRVKKSFTAGRERGDFSTISDAVLRPTAEERQRNPRSTSAKLRWARRAD